MGRPALSISNDWYPSYRTLDESKAFQITYVYQNVQKITFLAQNSKYGNLDSDLSKNTKV